MDQIKVVVSGICGRMGRTFAETLREAPDMLLTAGVDPQGAGLDMGELASGRRSGMTVHSELVPALIDTAPQVMVDFTTPEVVMRNLCEALSRGIRCVVGTTGITPANLNEISRLCKDNQTAAIVAPNFSVGAVLMMRFAAEAASRYEYAQIIEMHHPQKKDAPSGTAMLTAKRIEESCGTKMKSAPPEHIQLAGVMGGETSGIGVHALRMDGVVADQRVIFGAPGETLTLEHRTIGRECFMPGVLLAVRSVIQQEGLVVGLENLL